LGYHKEKLTNDWPRGARYPAPMYRIGDIRGHCQTNFDGFAVDPYFW